MRNVSHKLDETLIAIVLRHVNAWRKLNGWSRETVVRAIVEAHELSNADALTGISFESGSRDEFTRQKANADRVYRWLDDQTKDNNLLNPNFLPSILAAMPMEIRKACAADILRDVDIAVHELVGESGHLDPLHLLQVCMKESAEANQAIAELVECGDLSVLENTHREVSEAIDALTKARGSIASAMAAKKT